MTSLFAVVVTYNGMKWVDRCLGSLVASETNVSVIVVDNASSDGTPDYISEHYRAVELVRSDDNLGFAKANNIGIRRAYDKGAEYVFLLNQDAWIDRDTLSSLRSVAESDSNIGIVSPIHMNGEGSGLDWGFASCMPTRFISDAYMGSLAQCYKCDFVNAAAWLISRSCIEKIGGFDTLMFVHYGEDNNYCQRLNHHGFSLVIDTACKAYHDRETRMDNNAEYRNKVFKQKDLRRRIIYADVQNPLNIDKLIADTRSTIRWSYLKCRLSKVKQLNSELTFLNNVKKSRAINASGGLCWL